MSEETIISKWATMKRKRQPPPPPKHVVDYICDLVPEYDQEYVNEILQEDWYHCIDITDDYFTVGVYRVEESAEQYPLIGIDCPDLSGKTAIELGCAEGFFSFALEEKGAKVTALDFSEQKINHANFIKAIKGSDVDIRLLNMFSKDVDDLGKFNIVWATDVIQHVSENENGQIENSEVRFLQRIYDLCDWENDGTVVIAAGFGDSGAWNGVSPEQANRAIGNRLRGVCDFFVNKNSSFEFRSYIADLGGTEIRTCGVAVGILEIKIG